jgi:hypothetical protein
MYDPLDARGVPKTRGVPLLVRIAGIIGIVAIFAVGEAVVANAGYGHFWPAQETLRIPLSR